MVAYPTTPGGSGYILCGLKDNPRGISAKTYPPVRAPGGGRVYFGLGAKLAPAPGRQSSKWTRELSQGGELPPPGGHPSCGWPHLPPEGGQVGPEGFWVESHPQHCWRLDGHQLLPSPSGQDREGQSDDAAHNGTRGAQQSSRLKIESVRPCAMPGSTGRPGALAPSSTNSFTQHEFVGGEP